MKGKEEYVGMQLYIFICNTNSMYGYSLYIIENIKENKYKKR